MGRDEEIPWGYDLTVKMMACLLRGLVECLSLVHVLFGLGEPTDWLGCIYLFLLQVYR